MGRKISLSNRQVAAPGEQASRATVNQVNLAIQGKLALPAHLDAFEAIKAGAEPGDLFLKLRKLNGEILSTGVIIPISKGIFEIFEAREGIERLKDLRSSIEVNINESEESISKIKTEVKDNDEKLNVLREESNEAATKVKDLQVLVKKLEDSLAEAKKAGDKKAAEDFEKDIKENRNKIAIIWQTYRKDDKSISEIKSDIQKLDIDGKKIQEILDKLQESLSNSETSIKDLTEKADKLEAELSKTGSPVADDMFRLATDEGYPAGPPA